MLFEDFRVGHRWTAGPRAVRAEDLDAFTVVSGDDHPLHSDEQWATGTRFGERILQGSFGAAVAGGLWHRLGLVTESVVAATGETWEFHRPIRVGDELSLHVLITRLDAGTTGGHGLVVRAQELRDGQGQVVQSGSASTLVQAGGGPHPDGASRSPGTLPWARDLAEALGARADFASSVASWDGTVGLRAGDREVHLRIYRGRIIDTTTRAPHGATFTFGATDRTWADLLTADEARFGARLMTGEFVSGGNPYEYLRLTKALEIIVDAARDLATRRDREELPA